MNGNQPHTTEKDNEFLSLCCTARPMFELSEPDEDGICIGLCSRCRDHADFSDKEE